LSLIIIGLTIVSLIFFIKSHINKYSCFFFVMITMLSAAMYLMLLFTTKTTNYLNGTRWITSLDFVLYYLVKSNSISYYTIIRCFNITIALYFTALYYFVMCYFENFRTINKKKMFMVSLLIMLIQGFTIWFYDPAVCYEIYIQIQTFPSYSKANIIQTSIYIIDILNYLFICVYMIAIQCYILQCQKKSRSVLRRKQSLGMFVCVLLCNIILIVIFAMCIFRRIYILNGISALINVHSSGATSTFYIPILCALILIVFAMLFIVQNYDLTRKNDIFKMKTARKNATGIDKNMLSIFHSFKNIVFSYLILVRKAQLESGVIQQNTLNSLEQKLSGYVDELSQMLNIDKDIDIVTEKESVISVLETAISKTVSDKDIYIVKEYEYTDINAIIDNFYLIEALSNIIQNALDAIEQAERKGMLTFRVYPEYEWVVIEISDNGSGIKRKDMRKISKPFFTTKSRITNWGVGLSYTFNIIKKHGGHIYITSKQNIGTTFCILLPQQNK